MTPKLITGVTVVRTAYAEDHPEEVINFLKDYQKSVEAANNDIDGTAALCEKVGVVAKAAIAKKALPKCNIVYRIGDEMRPTSTPICRCCTMLPPQPWAASCRTATSTTPRLPLPSGCRKPLRGWSLP